MKRKRQESTTDPIIEAEIGAAIEANTAAITQATKRARVGAMTTDTETRLLNILIWNVENFTKTKRPNRRSNRYRIPYIANKIIQENIDIALFMETGRDVEDILSEIKKYIIQRYQDNYIVGCSGVTGKDNSDYGGETYGALIRESSTMSNFSQKIVALNERNYRGVWLLKMESYNFHLALFHAPSPSHPLRSVRMQVVKEVVEKIQNQFQKNILLVGDFNFKENEQDNLRVSMSGMTHLGPSYPNNLTSLRTEPSDANRSAGSQPYDQVWANHENLADSTYVSTIYPAEREFRNFSAEKIIDNLQKNYCREITSRPTRSSEKLTVSPEAVDRLVGFYSGIKLLMADLRDEGEKGCQWAIDILDAIPGFDEKLGGYLWLNDSKRYPQNDGEFKSVEIWLTNLGNALDIACSYYFRGRQAIALYRTYISDHLPILLKLTFPLTF